MMSPAGRSVGRKQAGRPWLMDDGWMDEIDRWVPRSHTDRTSSSSSSSFMDESGRSVTQLHTNRPSFMDETGWFITY
jgi:hypothetical protein